MNEENIYGLVEAEREKIAYYKEMIEEGGTPEELERFRAEIRKAERRIDTLMG